MPATVFTQPSAQPASDHGPNLPRIARRLAGLGLAAVVVAVLVAALPGLGEVRDAFRRVEPGWLAVTALLEIGSILAFVVAFRGIYCGRLPWRLSYRIAVAEQGANVLVPTGGAGGLAVGAWALARAGMDTERVARRSVSFFVLTSGVNFAIAIVVGLLLTVGVLPSDVALGWKIGPTLAALLVVATVCATPSIVRRLPVNDVNPGRVRMLLARGGDALADGIRDAGSLLLQHRLWVLVGSVGYMAFDAAALWAAFHAFGGSPEASTFLLAYVVGQLGGLIPLPGGLGGTDGGLIAALTLYGTPVSGAAASVLGYRLFQLGLPAVLGTLAIVGLRRDPAQGEADACN